MAFRSDRFPNSLSTFSPHQYNGQLSDLRYAGVRMTLLTSPNGMLFKERRSRAGVILIIALQMEFNSSGAIFNRLVKEDASGMILKLSKRHRQRRVSITLILNGSNIQ